MDKNQISLIEKAIIKKLKKYIDYQIQILKHLLEKEINLSKNIHNNKETENSHIHNAKTNIQNQQINDKLDCLLNKIENAKNRKNIFDKKPYNKNWKSRGFILIKSFIKKERIMPIEINNKTSTYKFTAKIKKQLKTIIITTQQDIYKNGQINFYIHDSLLNSENWEINDKDNQIYFYPS